MSRSFLRSLTKTGAATGLAIAMSNGSCIAPQVNSPCPVPEKGTAAQKAEALKQCFAQSVDIPFNTSLQKDVDILFVIDNSTSMSPKQNALAENIPKFIQKIESTGANYHVSVVSSDVGTLPQPGASWGSQLGTACESFIGDDGKLKRLPCSLNQFYTDEGRNACNRLCPDPKFVPEGGKGYISKVNGITNVPKEMVMGMDVGPQKAFQCMALIGDTGCGLEAPLESSKRALDGHNPENEGFLRPNSVLAVIYITDEDDCSVQVARRNENDPQPMDCTPGNKNAEARCFNPDYRCIARSVTCNESNDLPGQKTNCQERDNSYLEPIANYVRFFSALRPANKLLISGIWTPSIAKGGKFVAVQKDASKGVGGLNRGDDAATAACVSPVDNRVVGKPQVRLSKFAGQFKDSLEISVCETDKYDKALESIANAIKTKLEASCIPIVPTVQSGSPVCLVGDVDAKTPNNSPDIPFPLCSTKCCDGWANAAQPTKDDAGVKAACASETTAACYCALPSKTGACKDGAVLGVWRKDGGDGPPDKVTNVKCAGK